MNKTGEKYKLVILLCPSALNSSGYFDEFSLDGSYLGGQTRMGAAVDISSRVETFVVVGGTKKKIDDMAKYLRTEFKKNKVKPKPKIIRIQSEADTTGNLWAVKRTFREFKGVSWLKNKRVGLMTNFYHLPRAMRFSADIFKDEKMIFLPIIAEAVVNNIGRSSYLLYPTAFLVRVFNDIKGLKDWEEKKYAKQDKREDEWKYRCYDQKQLKKL